MSSLHTTSRHLRTDILIAALVLAFTALPIELGAPRLTELLDFFRLQPELFDFVANVVGYVPLGMVLAKRGLARALVLSLALSFGAEVIQLFAVGRSPRVTDVGANLLGAGVGVLFLARWQMLPERVAVTSGRAVAAAAAAMAYVLWGTSVTVETSLDHLAVWFEAPPWMNTNSRGASLDGTIEGHWTFDAENPNQIEDVSGSHLPATLVNGGTFSSGISGPSIVLDGQQWVDLGNPVSLRLTGSMSLSAWIRPLAFPWDDATIISSLTARELGYQLDLTIDQGPRTIGLKVADASGRLVARYGRTPILPNRWYHVAGVYDAESKTLDVYLDGKRDNGCLIGPVTDRQRPARTHVFVGRRAGLDGYEFIGAIDEVEIQSRARSPSEIEAEVRAVGRLAYPSVQEIPAREAATRGAPCSVQDEAKPPRIAGPLFTLGMVIALVCAGLSRSTRFEPIALSLGFFAGLMAIVWPPGNAAFDPSWLPVVYMPLGSAAVVFAARSTGPPPNDVDRPP